MTTIERASVAAIVEAAYREACIYNQNTAQGKLYADMMWEDSQAKRDLDALLADKSLDGSDMADGDGEGA